MNIVWDLDGVLRDLTGYIASHYNIPPPAIWQWKHNGKTLFDMIKEEKYIALTHSYPTQYLKLALTVNSKVMVWTSQPFRWRRFTIEWLEHYLPNAYEINFFSPEDKRRHLDFNPNTILVEDSPNFSSYDRIVLIDQDYNRHVDADRVFSQKQLYDYFLKMKVRLG